MTATDSRANSIRRHQTPQQPPYFLPELRYSVPEAAALLRQSVSRTWADIREAKLAVIREGAKTYIPGTEIVRRSRLPQMAS